MSDKRFDVIVYDLSTFRVTTIHARNCERRIGTFNAERMEQSALEKYDTTRFGVAIVERGEYQSGDVFED